MSVRYVVGRALEVSRSLPDNSVDVVITSPPFLGLRSYLPADHPDKGHEMGSEATPGAFLDVLLDLVEEWDRMLAPHGSIAVELGDTYSGSGSGGDDNGAAYGGGDNRVGRDAHPDGFTGRRGHGSGRGRGWPLGKSLCLVPQSFAFALAYGRNPHTGRETPPWRVRNWITWGRPNPPVGALGDKVRPASSFFTVACKSAGRYFDLDAVRAVNNPQRMTESSMQNKKSQTAPRDNLASAAGNGDWHTGGAPPLDWWADPYDEDDLATMLLVQATEPYPGAHYATWPRAVAKRLVDLLCPRKVCRVCGEPSRRIVGDAEYVDRRGLTENRPNIAKGRGIAQLSKTSGERDDRVSWSPTRTAPTVGWSDCGHNDNRNGCVFDPFAGTGATLAVASGAGLDAIGVDLDSRNVPLALDRVGPLLLTVEHFDETRAEGKQPGGTFLAPGGAGST